MEGNVEEVREEWNEVFNKCCMSGRRCTRSAGECKEVYEKCWWNSKVHFRCAGGVEGGVRKAMEVFKKCWRYGLEF